MCTWSAYTGKKAAAEILWNSLRKVEGVWGGFYTGLATVDDGKIHCLKTLGCTDVWKEKFDLSSLPGCTGIAHSRTNSSGDTRWSHPFSGTNGNICLISQGCSGVFSDGNAAFEKVGNMLLEEGKKFSSADFDTETRYPVLSDGSQVHVSDVAAQAVEYYYEKLNDPVKALREAFRQLPEEASSVVIFKDRPGVLGFANTNQRMVYQFQDDGVLLSISTFGFEHACGTEIPPNSAGIVTSDSIVIEKLDSRYQPSYDVPNSIEQACFEFIRNNQGCLISTYADKVLKKMFPNDKLCCRTINAYRILETLILEKKVFLKEEYAQSQLGTPGKIFKIYSTEN